MTLDELLECASERKANIDSLANDMRSQIRAKAEQIAGADTNDPSLSQWRTDLSSLQLRLAKEPEEATHYLCDLIERESGLKDVFKRNTDATNENLKGREWAKRMLGIA